MWSRLHFARPLETRLSRGDAIGERGGTRKLFLVGPTGSCFQRTPAPLASLVEPAERKHVFVLPVVSQATETLLTEERTIRAGPMLLTPAAATGAHPLESDEGTRQ